MTIRTCATADDVIDALGGTGTVAALVGCPLQNVSNWRARGSLPPPTFLILSAALEQIECEAPPELWGIRPADGIEPRPAIAAEGGAEPPRKHNLGSGVEPLAESASASAAVSQASSRVSANRMTREGDHV